MRFIIWFLVWFLLVSKIFEASAFTGQFTGNAGTNRFIPFGKTAIPDICFMSNEWINNGFWQLNGDRASWDNITAANEVAVPASTNTGFFVTNTSNLNSNGVLYVWSCIESATVGPTGPQGATGATGPQGATGATGLSTYDLAVAGWFTGSEVEFIASLRGPTGATGSLDFSTLSGTINLQNVVNLPTNDAILETDWFYFAITRQKEWVTYIDWIWVRNIGMVVIFLVVIWRIFIFITKRDKRVFN